MNQQPTPKKARTAADRMNLARVAEMMDEYLRGQNQRLETSVANLTAYNASLVSALDETEQRRSHLVRICNAQMARSFELEQMFATQLDSNDRLHEYIYRLEQKLRLLDPDFTPEFHVVDLTADSELSDDETILDEDPRDIEDFTEQ